MTATPHLTQWAAQFGVASELCRRGYDVGFTMGHNTPLADLLVIAPKSQTTFLVDVKGQRTSNFWRIKKKIERRDLYYVLAFVPPANEKKRSRYFILQQAELNRKLDEYEHSGIKYDARFSGMNWTTAHQYEDRWELLPQ